MQIVTPQSPAQFEAYYDLRWRILRAPWHQPRGSEQDELEADAAHRMIVDDSGKVIAAGRLHVVTEKLGQLRYMAVDEDYRKLGLGKKLLEVLEQAAQQQGLKQLMLHAREPVVGFYRHHGYRLIGQSHTLFGEIVHYEMHKRLSDDG
jgi:N-acetylglutamate synthase-like GNAT family acetyltransferase